MWITYRKAWEYKGSLIKLNFSLFATVIDSIPTYVPVYVYISKHIYS